MKDDVADDEEEEDEIDEFPRVDVDELIPRPDELSAKAIAVPLSAAYFWAWATYKRLRACSHSQSAPL